MMKNNQIKKILYNNPFAEARRKAMRSRLKNTSMTFLAPSCIGGILFHDLGLQFRSPTVNLMMFQPDFVKLVRFTLFHPLEWEKRLGDWIDIES